MQQIVGKSTKSTIPVECVTELHSNDIIVAVDKHARLVYMLTTTKTCRDDKMVSIYGFHLLSDSRFVPFVYDSIPEILNEYVNELRFIDVYKVENIGELATLIQKVLDKTLE
jgi:hypothetical protein